MCIIGKYKSPPQKQKLLSEANSVWVINGTKILLAHQSVISLYLGNLDAPPIGLKY